MIPSGDGYAMYQLDVDRIAQRHAGSEQARRRARRAESHAGRQLLWDVIDEGADYVKNYNYSSSRGVLYRFVR